MQGFLRNLKKKNDTPLSFSLSFLTVISLKGVKPSPDGKMIKLLTTNNLFPSLRHSELTQEDGKPGVTRVTVILFRKIIHQTYPSFKQIVMLKTKNAVMQNEDHDKISKY